MLFTRPAHCKLQSFLLLLSLHCLLPSAGEASQQKTLFPSFHVIQNNIAFWEDVYSTYSTTTAVIHDKSDLSVVYETVAILDTSLPGARRLNNKYLQGIKRKYAAILRDLGRGKAPVGSEEKKVYAMFSPPESKRKFTLAPDNIRVQTGLRERFLQGVIRSGAYMAEMKGIFRSYGLPEDLAYLPHVESSFDVTAYSKFGAAGMWQFTRSTGKEFMTIDYTIDERRDPISATKAAAEYLKRNFDDLGTWPLAITAYNYGHHGMRRAVNAEGTYENIFRNYNKGYFKFASRNFYAEFLAARNVAQQLERSGKLQLDPPRKVLHFPLPGFIDISELCHYFGLSIDEIRELNPALRQPVLHGEKYIPKGYSLRLPATREYQALAVSFPRDKIYSEQRRSHYYTVKQGDTAGKIARDHKISLKSLSRANNLNAKAVVYVGQTLKIPSLPGKGGYRKTSISQKRQYAAATGVPELKNGKKEAPAWSGSVAKTAPVNFDLSVSGLRTLNSVNVGEIIVQPEESLGIYAGWLKVRPSHLSALNGLRHNGDIHPGQKRIIPLHAVSSEKFITQRYEFHQETEEDFFSSYKITGFQNYTVAMGDTLWEICERKFDLPLWLLKKYNADLSYTSLRFKQQLNIPIVEAL